MTGRGSVLRVGGGIMAPGAGRSGNASRNSWEWLQESESDLSDDPAAFAGDRSERLATPAGEVLPRLRCVLAVILMYFCTREVVREVWHSADRGGGVQDHGRQAGGCGKLEKDVETIESARGGIRGVSETVQGRAHQRHGGAQRRGAHRRGRGRARDEPDHRGEDQAIRKAQTIAEKTKQFAKAPPAGGARHLGPAPAPPAKPSEKKKKAPEPKPKPEDGQPPPAGDKTSETDPSAGDEVIQKAEESLKRVEEVEAKSDEAKDKLEDALGLVDEKQRRNEEKERKEENEWLEGWVKEHQGEDSSILANVDVGAKRHRKDRRREDEEGEEGRGQEGRGGIDGTGDRSSSSSEDFVHENDVADDYADDERKASGVGDGGREDAEEEQRHGCGGGDYGRRRGGLHPGSLRRRGQGGREGEEGAQRAEAGGGEEDGRGAEEAAAREASTRTRRTRWPRRSRRRNSALAASRRRKATPKGAGGAEGAAVPSTSTSAAVDGDAEEAKGKPRRISSPGEGDCFDQSHQS